MRISLTIDFGLQLRPTIVCRSIDVNQDFYYIDDWADEYTIKQFGENFYNAHYRKRILRVDPYGNDTDILEWLESISLNEIRKAFE